MVGQTEQSSFSLGRKPHRQTAIGQQTRRIGLAISLTLALFVALALPAATFAARFEHGGRRAVERRRPV